MPSLLKRVFGSGWYCPKRGADDPIPIVYGAPTLVHLQLVKERKAAAGEPNGWFVEQERLLMAGQRHYDVVTIKMPDGSQRTFFFDITGFFGKMS
jgi:hypothetical protein